jgi:aminocarboxymuconate-semialdehyde decarboxylase
MNVDIHAHFVPQRLFEAGRRGKEWHGMSLVRDVDSNFEHIVMGGKFGGRIAPMEDGIEVGTDPERRVRMRKEQEDIDVQAMSILGSLWNYHLSPAEGEAYSREVNEELADLQKAYPQNFVGMALVPLQDTAAALRVLEHAIKDLGLRHIAITSNVNGLNLDHQSLWPIYEVAASEKMFVFCHPPLAGVAGGDRMTHYALNNTIGLPFETTLAVASLIFGGVLDRYPDLRICFCQGGGYAAYGIGRMHHGYMTKSPAATMQFPPGDYLDRLYYDCLIHNADAMAFLVDRVSADHVLLGTDFPMPDGVAGGTVEWVKSLPFLGEADKRKILGENAASLLGVSPEVGG